MREEVDGTGVGWKRFQMGLGDVCAPYSDGDGEELERDEMRWGCGRVVQRWDGG